MKEFNFFNNYHLGDCVLQTHFLRKVCEAYPDLRFICYIQPAYFKEIQAQIGTFQDRILLEPLPKKPSDAINGWAGSVRLQGGKRGRVFLINERHQAFFNIVSERMGVQNPIDSKCGTVIDNEKILEKTDPDLECDMLIVNSQPKSGQFIFHPNEFNGKISEWKDKYKIVTTGKSTVKDIPCTLDYGLNLLQIGYLSTKAKYIIGIATAPLINCFNKWNIDTVKRWVVLCNRATYSYNDRIIKRTIMGRLELSEIE